MKTEDSTTKLDVVSRNNKIYEFFKTGKRVEILKECELTYTPFRGKPSTSSLQYTSESFDSLFSNICENFDKLYNQATHNKKGLESSRIRTLHSSSLISFLTFCNVKKTNPIVFKTVKELDNKIFTEVMFEQGNKITRSSSQIDVCLTNSCDDVLFLESKFSEYTKGGKVSDISECYYNEFKKFVEFFKDNKLHIDYPSTKKDHKPNSFDLCVNEKEHIYAEGVKQMICHYLGAKNFANKNKDKNVYLGTILYSFNETIVPPEKLISYKNIYKNLAQTMNAMLPQNSNLHILEEAILYDDVLKDTENSFPTIVTDLYL